MTAIEPLLNQPAAQAIGWALLQFVWQGALIGLLTAAALALLTRSAADVRYVVATIALSLMLTMPVVTAVQAWRTASAGQTLRAAAAQGNDVARDAALARTERAHAAEPPPPASGADRPVPLARAVDRSVLDRTAIEPWLPMLLLGWLAGVTLLTVRLMSGWFLIERLKTLGTPADDGWQRMAARLCRRLHIRRGVRLLESSLVEVPTVIGWMKPVILLPATVLSGFSPQQLEAILAHELAHIRRHDYLVNLIQTLVETLLFYHPAVWWLSRRIRIERENCCDDLAVSLCGDPYTYARALADLEERRATCGYLAMAATGGSLLQRVRRLLGAPASHAGRGPGWLAGTAAIALMGAIVAGALGSDIMRAQHASLEPGSAAAVEAPVAPASAETGPSAAPSVSPAVTPSRRGDRERSETAVPVLAPAIAPVERDSSPALAAAEALERAAASTVVLATAARDLFSAAAPVLDAAQDTVGNFTWSHNGEKLQVSYRGQVEFTDDDADVKRLSPGGYLKIKDRGRTVEFRADASGTLERRFWVGTSERPFEPEGRKWLAQALPRFIRQTGIGAPGRVARILKAGGPSGVLAEIALIEGSWGKRVYFKELLRQAAPDAQTARQILLQAGREIDSDFELASLLIDSADKLLLDEPTRKAYFDAARSIESDFEMRRVYASALKHGPPSAPVLAGILDASRSIESDFELASLLVQIARLQRLEEPARTPFFAALATVDSDFEHRRVLNTLAARGDLTPEMVSDLVQSAGTLQSDFELAAALTQVVEKWSIDGALRDPFFRAVDSIGSAFERARVLTALARRPDLSAETVLAIVRAVEGVKSGHEASQVLLTVAASHPISGQARDLYIDAAEKLAEFEQGKVLTALVRNERRK